MIHHHQTAVTRFVEANRIRFTNRRFCLAATREVILFNNAGIFSRRGEVPASVGEMVATAAAFIKRLGFTKVDVLGFSLSEFGAQVPTTANPSEHSGRTSL